MSIREMLLFCIFDRFIFLYMKSKAKISHYNMIIAAERSEAAHYS
jgi:hypothetical protein